MHRPDRNLHLVHTDASFVVVAKPGGLLSVPGRGPEKQDCVTNRVKAIFPDCIDQPAVHRLDMSTSGLMVVALTRQAHRRLSRQFENRLVKKYYIALLDGIINERSGVIRLAFRLDPENRPRQVYDPVHGRSAITLWKKMATDGSSTKVEMIPLTGRTHQLRLHAAHSLGLGCPIIGDSLYGRGKEGEPLLLHATFLSFRHPVTGRSLQFHSQEKF